MKQRLYRWVCPVCGGFTLAPGKPRKLDVRRWCLPCSEEAGKLVERSCPKLDKQREAKAAKAAKKAKSKAKAKQRAKQASREARIAKASRVAYLYTALKFWWRLAAWQGNLKPKPTLSIQEGKERKNTSGHAYYGPWRITLTVSKNKADALTVLLHELAHLACYDGSGDHHGGVWKVAFMRAVEEVTGTMPVPAKNTAFAVHAACKSVMTKWFKEEGEEVICE